MREKKSYQVLTFHTTDAAMEMESFCKQNGIAGRLVPVPRRLSAGCGIAWRMEAEVYAQYQTVIADCGIEIEQSECLFNLDQFACFYIVKYNRKSEYWTLPADDF